MSDSKGDVVDGELSALLDSALEDFGRARNTDAELDSMMETMDREAAQKAASSFDSMMRNFTNNASNQPVLFISVSNLLPEAILRSD